MLIILISTHSTRTIPLVDAVTLTCTCFYFHRKAIIPIQMELAEGEQDESSDNEKEDEDPNLECYIQQMNGFRDKLFNSNIVDAQMKQKRDYDRKHGKRKVHDTKLYISE